MKGQKDSLILNSFEPVKLLNLPGMFPVDADGKTEKDPKRFPRFERDGVGAEGTDRAILKSRKWQNVNYS